MKKIRRNLEVLKNENHTLLRVRGIIIFDAMCLLLEAHLGKKEEKKETLA